MLANDLKFAKVSFVNFYSGPRDISRANSSEMSILKYLKPVCVLKKCSEELPEPNGGIE